MHLTGSISNHQSTRELVSTNHGGQPGGLPLAEGETYGPVHPLDVHVFAKVTRRDEKMVPKG